MSIGRRGGADRYVVISGGASDPIVLAGTVDPSAGGGVPAPEGSTYMRYVAGAGETWTKTGIADTGWTMVPTGPQVWTDDGTNITPVNANRALRMDSGGNARGANAVDFQQTRSAASLVASGLRAAILCGQNNRASAPNSAVICGETCAAQGTNSLAGGNFVSNAAPYSVVFGDFAEVNSAASAAFAHGSFSDARFPGCHAMASGRFSLKGDAQTVKLVLRRLTTTDLPPSVLTTNGVVPSASNMPVLQTNEVWLAEVSITAGEVGDPTNCAAYVLRCQIIRGATAATTAIVGPVEKTVINEVDPTWDADLSADTVNGALQVNVTGAALTNIRWVATVRLTITRTT